MKKTVQWFPGHMHRATKQIQAVLPRIDVIIEILDSRIPYSSANPMLTQLRGNKPIIKVLSKLDLADGALVKQWQNYFQSNQQIKSIAGDIRKSKLIAKIPKLCHQLVRHKNHRTRIKVMVIGIPNSGKSTLINKLAGRVVAKTGDEPAITKTQQFVDIQQNVVLLDTPGLLWPNVENPHSGYRLAITGAIRDTALSHEEIALYALDALRNIDFRLLKTRYGLAHCEILAEDMLKEIGQKRGCLVKGGGVEITRAAKIILSDIRTGKLGRITWETPKDVLLEEQEMAIKKINSQARKTEKKKTKHTG